MFANIEMHIYAGETDRIRVRNDVVSDTYTYRCLGECTVVQVYDKVHSHYPGQLKG